MRQGQYTVTFDRDFEGVITACAGRRSGRWHLTWITPKIMRTYAELFDAGHVHSFEVWNEKGELAGGGYGVSTGGAFSTESQFSHEPNTSKIGFAVLNWHLAKWDYAFNDGKLMTPTCHDMGFHEIARSDYLTRLAQAGRRAGKSGRWQMEADMATVGRLAARLTAHFSPIILPTNGSCPTQAPKRECSGRWAMTTLGAGESEIDAGGMRRSGSCIGAGTAATVAGGGKAGAIAGAATARVKFTGSASARAGCLGLASLAVNAPRTAASQAASEPAASRCPGFASTATV